MIILLNAILTIENQPLIKVERVIENEDYSFIQFTEPVGIPADFKDCETDGIPFAYHFTSPHIVEVSMPANGAEQKAELRIAPKPRAVKAGYRK